MPDHFERLRELCQVAPPPELDACVRRRMQDLLLAARTAAPTSAASAAPLGSAQRAQPEPVAAEIISSPCVLPVMERWIYAVGLFAYGTLAVLGAARLAWRAFAG